MTDREAFPNFRENVGPCECGNEGCTAYGTLKRANRKTGLRHVKGKCAPCLVCTGARAKSKGGEFQRESRNHWGIKADSLRTGHEENEVAQIYREAKAGDQSKRLTAAFELARLEWQKAGNSGIYALAVPAVMSGETIVAFTHRSQAECAAACEALAAGLELDIREDRAVTPVLTKFLAVRLEKKTEIEKRVIRKPFVLDTHAKASGKQVISVFAYRTPLDWEKTMTAFQEQHGLVPR